MDMDSYCWNCGIAHVGTNTDSLCDISSIGRILDQLANRGWYCMNSAGFGTSIKRSSSGNRLASRQGYLDGPYADVIGGSPAFHDAVIKKVDVIEDATEATRGPVGVAGR